MPAKIDQWVTIKDFRPGIKGRVTPGAVTRRPGEALGIAAPDNTYACQALPDGSLAPMPKNTGTFSFGADLPFNPVNATTGRLTISGYHRNGPIQTGEEAHVAFECKATSDSKRRYYWTRVRHFDTNQIDTLLSFAPGAEGTIGAALCRPTFFDNYRAHASDPTQPGIPGVTAGWFAGGGGSDRVWHMFPGASTPTSDTPLALAPLDPNHALSHQGRAVAFDQGSYSHGANGYVWTHNEDVWFTKANLTTLDVTAAQTYGAENASGYMATVSANHQEMLLVKLQGGGYLIRGDMKSPTVLKLPSLPPVTRHIPSVCPAGIVLLDCNKTGAWLWTGGETAENISRESLDADRFFLGLQGGAGGEAGSTSDFIDYTGKLIFWYDWVLFPNNWAWNYKDDSWWRLDNPANVRLMHYTTINQSLYGAPAYVSATTDNVEYTYDYAQAARTYRWTSQPIPMGENQMVMIREIVLVATGAGTVTITFTRQDGTTEAHAFTINSTTTPTYMRDNCDVNCQSIAVQIDVSASTSNVPIIHEVRMGVQNDKHYPLRTA